MRLPAYFSTHPIASLNLMEIVRVRVACGVYTASVQSTRQYIGVRILHGERASDKALTGDQPASIDLVLEYC